MTEMFVLARAQEDMLQVWTLGYGVINLLLTFPMINEVKRDGYIRYCSEYHYKLTVE